LDLKQQKNGICKRTFTATKSFYNQCVFGSIPNRGNSCSSVGRATDNQAQNNVLDKENILKSQPKGWLLIFYLFELKKYKKKSKKDFVNSKFLLIFVSHSDKTEIKNLKKSV